MTTPFQTHDRNPARVVLCTVAIALGLGTLLGAAKPADAGNEFSNGFEHELGRIVARSVAAIGYPILVPEIVVYRETHYDGRRDAGDQWRRHARRYSWRRHHRWHHGRFRHHRRHHGRYRHHHGYSHGRSRGHAHPRAQRTAAQDRGHHERHERRGPQSRQEQHSRYDY